MSIFKKQHTLSIPEPFSAEDIKLESSICTGESTIGFYDKTLKRLVYAELVRSEKDIRACPHRDSCTSFRQMLPVTALKILEGRQPVGGFLPCHRQNYA